MTGQVTPGQETWMGQAGQYGEDKEGLSGEPAAGSDDADAAIEGEVEKGHASGRPGRPVRMSQGLTGTITSTEHIPGPSGFFYADVPNRILAMIIDIIVLSLIGFVLAALFGGLVTRAGSLETAGGDLKVVPFSATVLLELLLSLAYFGYLWVTLRATLGMKLLGLQIGDETDGHSIGPRQAVVRWVLIGVPSVLVSLGVYVSSVIGLIVALVGLAWLALLLYTIARSHTKQGFHDRYAHTVMVKRRRRTT
jgi:uncharacterized RDD family membrane protein YckC